MRSIWHREVPVSYTHLDVYKRQVYGMVTVFIFIPLCIQREKKKRREQQKETLLLQFRDEMCIRDSYIPKNQFKT